jgi:hypothetical protein
MVCSDSCGSWKGQVECCCEHGDEPWSSKKIRGMYWVAEQQLDCKE